MGWVGWFSWLVQLGEAPGLRLGVDAFYRAIQNFFAAYAPPANVAPRDVPWLVEISRIAAPAVTIWTVVSLLAGSAGEMFAAFRERVTGRPVYTVVGFGHAGKAIAASLAHGDGVTAAHHQRSPRIVVLDRHADQVAREEATAMGVELYARDAGFRAPVLDWCAGLARAERVFVAAGSDSDSLDIAVSLTNAGIVDPARLWVQLNDYALLERLRDVDAPANPASGGEARAPNFFSLLEAAAEKFVTRSASVVEALEKGHEALHMVLVGEDCLTVPIIESVMLYGHFPGPGFAKPRITLVSPGASDLQAGLPRAIRG